MKEDATNDTHETITNFPLLFCVKHKTKTYGGYNNSILAMKNTTTKKDMVDVINSCIISEISPTKSSEKDLSRRNTRLDSFLLNGKNFLVSSNNKDVYVYDDNTTIKNVVYNHNKKFDVNAQVLGILIKRNYFNNSGDNLYKKITTIQTPAIYDVRDFRLNLTKKEIITGTNTSISGSANVKVDVSVSVDVTVNVSGSVSTGEEGDNQTVSSSGSGTGRGDGSGTGTGDINSGNTTATTEIQRTIYTIITKEDDDKFNQQFIVRDSDGNYTTTQFTAIFGAHVKDEGWKYTDDIKITCESDNDELHIDFDILWTNELSLTNYDKLGNRGMRLYIKMPNKLIYKIRFDRDEIK